MNKIENFRNHPYHQDEVVRHRLFQTGSNHYQNQRQAILIEEFHGNYIFKGIIKILSCFSNSKIFIFYRSHR